MLKMTSLSLDTAMTMTNKRFINSEGAGYHKIDLQPEYKKICRKACLKASKILNTGGSALLACQVAIMVLEESPMTNAGYGSSLTISGSVECDASIMDGETLNFGACGAVKGVKYPISLAARLCQDQLVERPLGLIQPTLLVGQGAKKYAKLAKLKIIDNKKLISKHAYLRYKKCKRLLKENTNIEDKRLDTVGAVCVDGRGHVAAACSSGGIGLKYDGRVGQAAIYASGVWADSTNNQIDPSVAVTTTGAGEYLIKTLLAKEIAINMKKDSCPVTAFHSTFKEGFLDSHLLKNIPDKKLGGALALYVSPSGDGELIWGHSCRTMGFAYMDISKNKATGMISELPRHLEGISTIVSGTNFKLNLS